MMMPKPIYLDYNATAPCAPEVLAAMLSFFTDDYGNPASPHIFGRKAARSVSEARSRLAHSVGAKEEEVCFTSGATESNNLVLLGVTRGGGSRRRIVVTAIEHKSVLEPAQWLALQGYDIVQLPVTRVGVVDLDAAKDLINTDTLLVCIQGANNEIGTIQPVRAIAEIAHQHGALVHCDASQMLGKVPVSIFEMDVDSASFSAHKICGPKGIGALFVRASVRDCFIPVYLGGGQEFEIRPGTLNVPGIVGFGVASVTAVQSVEETQNRTSTLRDSLECSLLRRCRNCLVIGRGAERLPNTSNICFRGIPADVLLAQLPLICAGIGSACSSGSIAPSHVLLACGLTRENARCAVRFSLGRYTTEDEVFVAIEQVAGAVESIRRNGSV
jgi:cysteine desulfurase